ncbi:hypothetical protein EYF80_036518 [Liparis tanakae]|uniref:Uncharacterized protein n=1 Tax=Liparis tanakae TaxID=230148 RepID=A0A4Z2GKI1_9TELE|nr:hypothetical protein EYF80_036518 [Liparis tanakae]
MPPIVLHISTTLSSSLPYPFARVKTQFMAGESYRVSCSVGQALMLSILPLLPFTCLREIPMQLPILYSMSSSGEVTLALHGLQSTFLQNCIVRAFLCRSVLCFGGGGSAWNEPILMKRITQE